MKTSGITTIQSRLEQNEALLVQSTPNRFYLTGLDTSDGLVLVTRKQAYFLIDFRYVEKAKQTVKSCEVVLSSYSTAQIAEICAKDGATGLYLEWQVVSLSRYEHLKKELLPLTVLQGDAFDRLLCELRSVKTKEEIDLIRQAQRLTDDTFSYITEKIEPGRTERDIMLEMEFFMRHAGSQGVSFDFIVISGKNTSLPHGVPTEKRVEPGDFVTMDFGAVVGGYRSDMTRTVAVGSVSDEQKRVYDTVLQAQQTALSKIKAGEVCRQVDKAARSFIDNAGYKGCFGHGLGHSVGIEIHESPAFNTRCETVLKPGMVITVEPGIYLENRFGVRIEDMVIVTESGCENITASPKELLIL